MSPSTAPKNEAAEVLGKQDTEPLKRLHISTIGIPLVETLFALLIPFIVMSFVMNPRRAFFICSAFIALPNAIRFILQYATTCYRLDTIELVIRSGLAFRKERRIPLERIQDVEIHQTLFRRFLGLATLKITTAGAETEEAALNVLKLNEAETMRRQIANAHTNNSSDSSPEDPASVRAPELLSQLTWRDLALGGLTSNLVAALAAVLGAFLYLDYFQSWGMGQFDSRIEETIQDQTDKLDDSFPLFSIIQPVIHFFFLSGSVGKALLFAIIGAIGSIGSFNVRYYGFKLLRSNNIITRSYGLLNTHCTSLAQNRIQAIKIEEGLLRRLFGLVAIRADSAGDRQQIDENKKREWLLPVAQQDEAHEVIGKIQPDLVIDPAGWQRVSPKAIMRRTRIACFFILLASLQTFFWEEWLALAWIPSPFLAYYANKQWYHNTRYCLTDRYVLWRTGWIQRSALFLPIKNIQNVSLTQSPFDRHLHLASLSIDTAGQSNTGGGPVIRHLPVAEAHTLQEAIIRQVAQSKFVW